MNDLQEVSDNDLTIILDDIQKAITNENFNISEVLENDKESILRKVFPSRIKREISKVNVERIKAISIYDAEFMKAYTDTQLEITRRKGEAIIKASGAHLQTELAKFVTEKINEMDSAITQSRMRFLQNMKPHLDEIEEYRDYEMLYQPAKDSAKQQYENFMATIQEMLTAFTDSIKNS